MINAHGKIEFYGLTLSELVALDRVNVDAWMRGFHYLNAREMSVTMALHEIAVDEMMNGEQLSFSVSEIMKIVENKDIERRIEQETPWSWKMVKATFDRMQEKGHIARLPTNSPSKKKVEYRITQQFREMIREYYAQYAKICKMISSKMQLNDAASTFDDLVKGNQVLIDDLNLEDGNV